MRRGWQPDTLRRAGVMLGLVLPLICAPAAAQDERGRAFDEAIEVELVNVEVWVTDGQGNPVSGLSAGDFRILQNGESMPITHFSELRAGVVVAGADSQPLAAATAPGHLVVYFDDLHLQPRDRKRLVRDVSDFMTAGDVPPGRVLVLRQERSLFVGIPFGSSRSEVAAGLTRLADSTSAATVADSRQMLRALQDLWARVEDTAADRGLRTMVSPSPRARLDDGGAGGGAAGSAAAPAAAGRQTCQDFVDQVQPMMAGWVRERHAAVSTTLKSLWDTISFLAGVTGAKTLLYLGGGLETNPGSALASYLRDTCPAEGQKLAMEALHEDLTPSFRGLTRHANANRVTIYAVQGSGWQSNPTASSDLETSETRGARSFEVDQRDDERQGLRWLAEETGGRAIFGTRRLRRELQAIGQEMGTYYSLAYRPPESDADTERRIDVAVSDGSLALRHRRSYGDKDPEQRLNERLLGAVYLGLVDNPLEVRLGAGAIRPGDEGALTLPLHVMVPVERLTFLPQDGGSAAQLWLKTLAIASGSGRMATWEGRFRALQPAGETGGSLDLTIELQLEAGEQMVAVALQDEASRLASFVSTTLQVDPPADSPGRE